MKRGDIVLGENNTNPRYPKNGHPIVFLENKDAYTFVGLMLTTKSHDGMNNLMEFTHFMTHDENGNEYEFKYSGTHIVPVNLLKKLEWAPFTKIGKLTPEGISFVENIVANTEPVYWEEVVNKG